MKQFRTASWFQAPNVQQLFAILGPANSRLVGGCVRDTILGHLVTDIDMACVFPPQDIMTRLKKANIRVVPTGIDHGTVSAQFADQRIEITSLRRDVRTDGRRAQVMFGGNWLSDAQRRDFTINALYLTADGEVDDPLNKGLADLKAQRIRFIGDATARIKEDYLRIVRFFRMQALLGQPKTERATLSACRKYAPQLRSLSAQRIQSEIWKLLVLPHCAEAMAAMTQAQIMTALLPLSWGKLIKPGLNINRLQKLVAIDQSQFFAPDACLRLAALLPHDKAADFLSEHWKLRKTYREYLADVLRPSDAMVCYLSAREVRRLLYRYGVRSFKARAMLAWAEDKRPRNAIQWRAMLAMADSWRCPRLPLTGQMMHAAGVSKGPDMSRIRREVEQWWIDSDFTMDKFSIIERLKAIVQATVY